MSDLLGPLVDFLIRALTRLLNLIPSHRIDGMPGVCAWSAAACFAGGIVCLLAAAWTGLDGPFLAFRVLLVATLALFCVGAFWPRPVAKRREGRPRSR